MLSFGCPIRALTGFDCPGCGGTRALLSLMEGNVVEALSYNLYATAVIPMVLAWMLYRFVWQRQPVFEQGFVSWWKPIAVVVTLATFTFLRNVEMWPFMWMNSTPL